MPRLRWQKSMFVNILLVLTIKVFHITDVDGRECKKYIGSVKH